jgi:hypothetical protein
LDNLNEDTFSGKGDKNLLQVAELIQEDDDLYNFVVNEVNEPWIAKDQIKPQFLKRMWAMLDKRGNQLLKVKNQKQF